MSIRRPLLALLAPLLLLTLVVGVQRAEASTFLGSPDPSVAPEAFACGAFTCPANRSVGFRQFALLGADTVAEETGVLVSARVNAKRLAGGEQPRIAVLRPAAGDDIGVTVAAFAPLPVVSAQSTVHEVTDLHLPVEPGDSIGFLMPSGQVDLGMATRPQPDGAVQWFVEPCAPCHMDGGTGRELLFDATVEPDVDGDGLGDESQDPDLGLGEELFADDELDDWFDELDEDEEEEPLPKRRRALRLRDITKAPNGDPVLKVQTPGRGFVSGTVTTSGGRWDRGLPRTIGFGQQVRSKRAGRIKLRLKLSRAGRRMLQQRGRQRAVVVVSHRSVGDIKVAMRRIRQ